MKGKHRIEFDNPRHTLHRVVDVDYRLSSDENEKFKKIMFKIIEDPF